MYQSLVEMMMEPKGGRIASGTEYSWCRAVPGGTGIAVLAILTSKVPETSGLQDALNKLQSYHPILRSRLHTNPSKNTFSFVTSPTTFIQVKSFNLSSTSKILESSERFSIAPLQLILEHELNENAWCNLKCTSTTDMLYASSYALPDAKWVVALRLHVAACDRTTAVSLLKELLLVLVSDDDQEQEGRGEVNLAIEALIPKGKAKKALWARGRDMLTYSVNSLKSTNLKFIDAKSPRSSQVVRLQLNKDDTERILLTCKSRGIKLCGMLAAAGLIAAHNSDNQRKYAVATLTDCRSILEPPLSNHRFGFYHSAIMNTHLIKRGEKLGDLAEKIYTAFANSKHCNRHFSDMADLNFLMCKAIENPSLTPASSLRSSFMSVFEDSVFDSSNEMQQQVGLEDYMGCASVHGIGPSIALFDTIRDGRLDCVCVYPSPLHSREQMQELVEKMKSVLVQNVG
ncbi:hypothetical protein AB3S75_032339 [Citrus x aurantiifolia]